MRSLLLILLVLAVTPLAAEAQRDGRSSFVSGFKLKGNVHYNRTAINNPDLEARAAYGLGIEFVGSQLGVGLYGYSDGSSPAEHTDTTTVFVVAEANFYLAMEDSRIAPYIGVHTHLGNFNRSWFDDPSVPSPQDGFDSLGYQIGVRYQPFPLVALDAQWRRQSQSVWDHQNGFLDRNQFLVGVVLF